MKLLAALSLVIACFVSLALGAGVNDVDTLLISRVPRTLAAMMVGGGLALAGTMLQCVTRNPLAEPGLLGVNAGGVLGLTIGVAYFAAASTRSYMLWAGGGALAAITLVLIVSGLARRTSPPHLILIGIAASATLGGIANAILMAHATALEQLRFWNLGSVAGAKLEALKSVLPFFLAAGGATFAMTRWLSAMQLGEDQAKSLGVPTAAVLVLVWVATALLTACALAIAGPVTFAGFLAAYAARYVAGPRFGAQLGYSLVFGMVLLLVGDVLARTVIQPFEVPVGVVLALIGTPLTIVAARSRAFRGALVEA